MPTESTTGPAPRRRGHSPKRKAVLDAATAEFLAHGFAGTSMDRIAEAARVSKRTVYDHFPGKDALFQAIADEILARISDMPEHVYAPERPLEAQLLAIGHTFAETITDAEFMDLSRVVIARFIQRPSMAENTLKAHRRLRRDMIALLAAGKKDGRLSLRSPEMAAAQLCGLIKELAFWPQLTAGQEPLSTRARRAAVRAAVGLFLDHYGVRDA